MYVVVAIAILVTMALALTRALLGPTAYDRMLAVNMFGTKIVLLLAVLAMLAGRADFLDLALTYALINFIGILAALQFFQNHAERCARVDERVVVVRPLAEGGMQASPREDDAGKRQSDEGGAS